MRARTVSHPADRAPRPPTPCRDLRGRKESYSAYRAPAWRDYREGLTRGQLEQHALMEAIPELECPQGGASRGTKRTGGPLEG